MNFSGEPPTDNELLSRSKKDPEAFGDFYERHSKALMGFFVQKTLCPEIAADLTSETFAQALLVRSKFRGDSSARTWLFAIAHNQLSAFHRREEVATRARHRIGVASTYVDEAYVRIEEVDAAGPLVGLLRRLIASLPQTTAEAVELRVCEELPYDEVADRIGCSPGAARVRVSRGIAQLSQQLEVLR